MSEVLGKNNSNWGIKRMLRRIKILSVCFCFSIFLMKGVTLFAEGAEAGGVAETSQSSVTSDNADLTVGLIGRIVIYLMLLGAIGVVVVYFFKQGKFVQGIRSNNKGSQLKVCETHTLGNKQFLVVVEYGKQKVLLGIGPGMINKLCFLESTGELNSLEEKK